jgi:hypothetical protein
LLITNKFLKALLATVFFVFFSELAYATGGKKNLREITVAIKDLMIYNKISMYSL